MKKIYVGNLSYDASEADLEEFFAKFGEITKVDLIKDYVTSRSKGFAFVEYANADGANAALKMDGQDFKGRKLKVSMARDKREGEGGGRRGGGRGGDRGDRGGRGDRY